jgi:hypothetical protein
MTGTVAYAKLCAAGACMLLFAAAGGLAAWAIAGALVVILALLGVGERVAPIAHGPATAAPAAGST